MASKVTVFTLVSALCVCNILFYVLYLSPTVQLTYDSEVVTARLAPCNYTNNIVLLRHFISTAGANDVTTSAQSVTSDSVTNPEHSDSTDNSTSNSTSTEPAQEVSETGNVVEDYRTHQTTTVVQTTYFSVTNQTLNATTLAATSTAAPLVVKDASSRGTTSVTSHKPTTSITSRSTTSKTVPTTVIKTPVKSNSVNSNYHPYSYILNNNGLCSQPDEVLLVILVCSGLEHLGARMAIRETWGAIVQERTDVKLAFVMGKTENQTLQQSIVQEAYNYSDVIQEDFLDTYNNLTLKSIMLLKFADTFCSNAKYVMKVDDDMFVNLSNLLRYLVTVKNKSKMLFGRLVKGARAIRDKKSKWYVPETEYKAKIYPDYLSGTGYVMSSDVVHTLYSTAQKTPMVHLEDVYVTGIVARKAVIPRKYHSGFTYEKRPVKGCAFRGTVTGHKVTPEEIRQIWKELNEKNLKCNNPAPMKKG